MEKILSYNGRDVRFKSTAALPLRYKAQFGRDLFEDLRKMMPDNVEPEARKVDIEIICNAIWALAKNADPSIKPPMEWYDEFESLPVFEWFTELWELMVASFGGTRKN
jgi:hypothetical protein